MKNLFKGKKFIFSILTGIFLLKSSVYAQTAPSNVDPGAIDSFIKKDLIRDINEPDDTKPREKQKPQKKEETTITKDRLIYNPQFTLDNLVFEGNTVLTEDELQQMASKYTDREIYISDLIDLAVKITKIYQEKGYASSFAYIPVQKIDSGEAKIKIVESKVGEIEITGNKWSRKTYLKDIVLRKNGIKQDEVFNIRNLKPTLDELNEKEYLEGRIAIEEGETPELTKIILEVEERPPLNLNFAWDSEGRKVIGAQRAIFQIGTENLTGFGDSLYGATVIANGTVGVLSGYNIPIGPFGTELQFDYSYSHVNLGKEFKLNKIKGYSHTFGPKIVQKIYKSYRTEITTDLGIDFINANSMDNKENTLINQYNLRVLRNNINLKKYDSEGLWLARIENAFGLDFLGATGKPFQIATNIDPTHKFYKLYTEVIRYQRLPKNSLGIIRASQQYTPEKLFAAEQFQLGGVNSVRGFESGQFLGDVGFNVSAEVRTPLPLLKKILPESKKRLADKVRLGFFYDCGFYDVLKDFAKINSNNFIQSIGTGIHITLIDPLTASFDIGIPIGGNRFENNDARLHFAIRSSIHDFFFKEPELL